MDGQGTVMKFLKCLNLFITDVTSCVLWGARVVIPIRFQRNILDELHWEYPGTCSMKALARSYVWWPK